MRVGWEGIEEFVIVAEAGSFTAGAAIYGSSVTHMSRAIGRLETRVEAQLFHRTTRSVRLTNIGRTFLEQCQRIMLERDEAIAMINETGEPQGELRITCSTALGERFVAPIVRRYCEMHSKVAVSIELNNRLVDLIAEGYDIAVRTGSLTDNRLVGTRIASRTLFTCAAPRYLQQHGRPNRPVDLQRHQCLTGTGTSWHFIDSGRPYIFKPHGRWRCNSGSAVADAAIAGMGLCQLPEFYVLPHLLTGALELVLEDFRAEDEPIWAVCPQRRHMLPKIKGLVKLLSEELPSALRPEA